MTETKLALTPGTKLCNGAYRIVRTIGRGGFSIVYEARNARGDTVAIKELFPSEAKRRRFLGLWETKSVRQTADWKHLSDLIYAEFRLVHKLHHPNIVRVIELFPENDTLYLAMEYLAGQTLQDHLFRQMQEGHGGLAEADALIVAASIGEALAYAHAKGVVHRDVKPSNILVCNDGRVVLLDFGIARRISPSEIRTRAGTQNYMAPEQFDGHKQTRLVDVYALGATIYHVVCGHAPPSVVERRKGEELKPPHTLAPHLSEHASLAIVRAMALAPEERTPNTTAFIEEFRGTPPALARYDEMLEAKRSFKRTVGIIGLAVIVAAAVWLVLPR